MALPTILDLAMAYRRGRSRPSDVLEALLAVLHPGPTFRFVTATRARAQAVAADARFARGRPRGLLDGVPIALKDLIDTSGDVTTVGSAALAAIGKAASEDADVARALDAAGAVFVGKTTMTELAFSGLGLNQHAPVPVNALDPTRVPGGSSSGSAVAVARGEVSVAVGSDTGGSVRIPAAFNGLVGLKPSRGALSMHGVAPVSRTLDTLGPLARGVADAWVLWSAMRGEGGWPFAPHDLEGLRIAAPVDLWRDDLDADVAAGFAWGVDALARAGLAPQDVEGAVLTEIDAVYAAAPGLGTIEALAGFGWLLDAREPGIDPRVVRRIRAGAAATGADLARLLAERERLERAFWRAFEGYDVLVAPTVACLPPRLEDVADPDAPSFATSNARVVRNPRVANYVGAPAATVPALVDGLRAPVGFMVMARPGHERLVMSVATVLEVAAAQAA